MASYYWAGLHLLFALRMLVYCMQLWTLNVFSWLLERECRSLLHTNLSCMTSHANRRLIQKPKFRLVQYSNVPRYLGVQISGHHCIVRYTIFKLSWKKFKNNKNNLSVGHGVVVSLFVWLNPAMPWVEGSNLGLPLLLSNLVTQSKSKIPINNVLLSYKLSYINIV